MIKKLKEWVENEIKDIHSRENWKQDNVSVGYQNACQNMLKEIEKLPKGSKEEKRE